MKLRSAAKGLKGGITNNNKFGNAKSAMIQVFSLSNLIAMYPRIAED